MTVTVVELTAGVAVLEVGVTAAEVASLVPAASFVEFDASLGVVVSWTVTTPAGTASTAVASAGTEASGAALL